MNNRKEMKTRLLNTLKALERELQYRGLEVYERRLQQKGSLNGKEKYTLRGVTARLNLLEADRRSRLLGLNEYIPYDERQDKFTDDIVHSNYRAWDRTQECGLIF